ncbi:cytochrome c [Halomonas campisalis]|nr:cytochrome c [Halomonas campisalis]MDR5861811.1 cytochrome c [Halomonas campisalis]
MTLRKYSTRSVLLLALTALPTWLMAGDHDIQHSAREQESSSEDLVLRSIMRELDENMREVVGAISRENWDLVAEITPLIADHPEPPLSEKTRILRFVGTDAARFVGHDRQVHEAAMEMGAKARQEDGEAVIEAFSRVQKHCLDCHQEFKEEFRLHFYGE